MNVDTQLCDQLELINNVFKQPIDAYELKDPLLYKTILDKVNSTPLLKTSLMSHQAHMVTSMFMYKQHMLNGYNHNHQSLRGKMGIIADPPGSGKTLSVLGFIAVAKDIDENPYRLGELNIQSTRYFFSHSIEPVTDAVDLSETTVVVVSPYILQQWCREVETHTRLQPFVIDNRRILRNHSTPTSIVKSHFVLTTSRLYKDVCEFMMASGLRIKHLFIDDATTLYLGANDPILPHISFLWLVTSRWWSFMFKNTYINPFHLNHVRNRFSLTEECLDWLNKAMDANAQLNTNLESSSFFRNILPYYHSERSILVLRNSKSRLAALPNIQTTSIECYTKLTLASIPVSIIGNNYEGLTHRRIPRLFRALDVSSRTLDEIITHHSERKELIKSKQDDDCPICLDTPQNKVWLSCCMNVFCGACVLRQLMTHPQCPTCRALLYLPNFLYTPDKEADVSASSVTQMNRQDACIHYIKNNPNNHYIIYSPFENSYYQMYPALEQEGIVCERLDTNIGRFHRSIVNFNKGTSKVLFVSNPDFLQGLTLSKATHLFFFYDLPFFEQKQTMVDAAQRLGRLEPLTLVHMTSSLD